MFLWKDYWTGVRLSSSPPYLINHINEKYISRDARPDEANEYPHADLWYEDITPNRIGVIPRFD